MVSKSERMLVERASVDLAPLPRLTPRGRALAEHDKIARMADGERSSERELERRGLIFPEMHDQKTLHAFRELRTMVLQRTGGANGVLLVTATSPGGGASFVAKNLAVAFGMDPTITSLIVDCNVRATHFDQYVDSRRPLGLTDYLEEPRLDAADIIHPFGVPRVRVVPAGRRRNVDADYFTLARTGELLEELRSRYPDRFVILDAPPVAHSAEAKILTEHADHALLVVPYGRATERELAEAARSVGPERLFGAVLNRLPHRAM